MREMVNFNRSFSAKYIVGELLSRERETLVKYYLS